MKMKRFQGGFVHLPSVSHLGCEPFGDKNGYIGKGSIYPILSGVHTPRDSWVQNIINLVGIYSFPSFLFNFIPVNHAIKIFATGLSFTQKGFLLNSNYTALTGLSLSFSLSVIKLQVVDNPLNSPHNNYFYLSL